MAFRKIKTKQLNDQPVKATYASEAALIAAQAAQFGGYIYYILDDAYYEYLGTTLGTMADYRLIGGGGSGGGDFNQFVEEFTYTTGDPQTYELVNPALGLPTVFVNSTHYSPSLYTFEDNIITFNALLDHNDFVTIIYFSDGMVVSPDYVTQATMMNYVANSSPVLPPVNINYPDSATMFADQINQREDFIYYNGTGYFQYLGTTTGDITDYREVSSPPVSLISLTFAELQALITGSELEPGVIYLVNDFQTIHRVVSTSTDINTGPVEPLYAVATSANTLSREVRSITYPQDSLEVDWTNVLAEDGTTPRKGLITFRHDKQRNVSTYFDFRNWKVRRWQFLGFDHETGFIATTPTNITLTLTWSANMTASYLTVYRKWEVRFPALVHDAGTIDLTITKGAFTHTRPLLRKTTLLSDWLANELSNKYGPIVYSPALDSYILMDIYDIGAASSGSFLARAGTAYGVGNGLRIAPGVSFNDYLTFYVNYDAGNVNNVHLGPGCSNNFFIGTAYNFTLGGYSSNNTFVGSLSSATLEGESNNNLFLGGLHWSQIGAEFGSNVIGWDANYTELYKFCHNNNILPGGFNFEASQAYINNSTVYTIGWFYKLLSAEITGSFIGLTGSQRSDVTFEKEIVASIIGYFNGDSLSFRKALISTFTHTRPTALHLLSTINLSNLPVSSAGLNIGDVWNDAGTLKIVI